MLVAALKLNAREKSKNKRIRDVRVAKCPIGFFSNALEVYDFFHLVAVLELCNLFQNKVPGKGTQTAFRASCNNNLLGKRDNKQARLLVFAIIWK